MARWGGRTRPAMQVPSPSVREAASMYGTAVAVFLVILVAALQGSAPAESPFPFHIPLDPEGTLELSWNVSYAQETVYFRLVSCSGCRTEGSWRMLIWWCSGLTGTAPTSG